jgi:hypothetical protein
MMLARFLSDADREVFLGDLAESQTSRCEAFREILLLLLRRQRANWLWILFYGGLIAWQFFMACNYDRADGHPAVKFALGCWSLAVQNLVIAGTLWRSGRAIWLNAILASAVESGATLYLNLTAMHGSRPFWLRMALATALGPALLFVAAHFRYRIPGYPERFSLRRRRSGS